MKTKHCHWLAAAAVSFASTLCLHAASTLQFGASSYTVAESAGFVTLSVQRLNDPNTAVSVEYATSDGTATNGIKYSAVSGTLAFKAGDTNQTIIVPVLNEGTVEGSRSFRVGLSNPTGGAVLGGRSIATVLITDNDVGLEFQFPTYSVAEDAGTVSLGIVRGDDGILPVTVQFATSDLSGTNAVDYIGATNTLSFAPQERLKFVTVPILNNKIKQPNRNFRVTLANPAGVSLGFQKTATITIVDNDQGFHFDLASYAVAEDGGAVRMGVFRGTDETNLLVSVDVATSDSTATSGLDYAGITNTLSFARGETLKLVTVPVLNNGLKQPARSFHVTLSNPTGGAALSSSPTAAVTILDNDPGIGFELSSQSVLENAGSLTVTVLRGNDMALGPVAVGYATSDLTAKAGLDYQAVSGTVAFNADETIKTITIPILRNASVTNTTRFVVTLANPTGGAVLETASMVVTILDATGLGTYRTVAPPFETELVVRRDGDVNVLTWAGDGQLQRGDSPVGPWQTLPTATNPFTARSPVPTSFYRVTLPRPTSVYVPSSYSSQTPMPLVILLHSYGGNAFEEGYMRFRPLAESRGFLYCHPDGTIDRWGNRFWSATDVNDPGNSGVDDAGYLRHLIEEIGKQFAVDRKRVYVIGRSNGAFMAYRLACQSADLIAGIVSYAGVTFLDPNRCTPSEPVNILQIHATADDIVPYAGGAITIIGQPFQWVANTPAFPGALQTVGIWATYNGASDPVSDSRPSLNLDLDVPGLDTVITRYTNSPAGGAVELWTINGGSHLPTLYSANASSEFAPRIIDWLFAHPKP